MKITVQFTTEGRNVGPPLLIPMESSSSFLLETVRSIDPSFSENEWVLVANNRVVGESVFKDCISGTGFSIENVLTIDCLKTDQFSVKPVSRSCATLSGHQGPVLCCQFTSDSRLLASGSGDKTVRIWDTTTMTPIKSLVGHSGFVLALSWSYDNKLLASGDSEGTVIIWDHVGNLKCRLSGHKKWITSVAWEPSTSSNRLVSSSKDGTCRIWDCIRGVCEVSLSHLDCVTSVKWPSAGLIISASHDQTVRFWGPNGSLVHSVKCHAHWINSLATNLDHNNRLMSLPDIKSMVKSPEESKFACCSDDFTISLSDFKGTKAAIKMVGHQGVVNHISFSPDGKFLASASFDKSVKLWCGKTGKFLGNLRGHVGPVYQLVWSSDSKMILSCSKDSTVKVWDASALKLKNDLSVHLDEVYCVDWAPDGQMAASGGKDHKLVIWKN